MIKPRVAVGVVQGAIHFMFHNGDFEEELDTLGKGVYKYPLDPMAAEIDPISASYFVYLDGEWKRVYSKDLQIWDAMLPIRKRLMSVSSHSRRRRNSVRIDMAKQKSLLPLHGE